MNTVEDLKQRGIGFQCLTQDINTTTSGGKLVFGIFAALVEFEKDLIRERTVAGLEAARKRGRLGGRPSKLSKSDIQAAKAMLDDEGLTVAEIADKLGVSRRTLYRTLPGGRGAVKNGVV